MCYGMIFPDVPRFQDSGPSKGKVFSVRTTPSGGLAGPAEDVELDVDEWDDCQQCEEFESCYKLCLAKMSLKSVLSTQ
jgi:hypothetical protein